MQYFRDTVDSVLQLGFPFEWIIVDDCSTDGTREYLDSLTRRVPHIRLLLNDERAGDPRINYLRGFDIARGKYLIFLDHDDTLGASRVISAAVARMQAPGEPRVTLTKVAYMDEASRVYKIKVLPFVRYTGNITGKRLFWTLFLSPTYPLKQGAVIIDKALFSKTGMRFDIAFLLAATQYTDFFLLDGVGLNYRNLRSSLSATQRLRDRERFWMRFADQYLPNRRYCGIKYAMKSYKWLLGWMKILYGTISPRRL